MPLMSLSNTPQLALRLAASGLYPASTVVAAGSRTPAWKVPRLLRARQEGPVS